MNLLKPKKIPLLIIIGTAYFIFVLILGSFCYGMECIGLVVFGTPIYIISLPWGILANVFPDVLQKDNGLLIYPFSKPSSWPGLITIYIGFMFNLWLLGKAFVWLMARKKEITK